MLPGSLLLRLKLAGRWPGRPRKRFLLQMPLDGVILGHWVSEGGGSHLEGLPGLKEEEVLAEERRVQCFLRLGRGFPPAFLRAVCPGATHSTARGAWRAAKGLGPWLCGSHGERGLRPQHPGSALHTTGAKALRNRCRALGKPPAPPGSQFP